VVPAAINGHLGLCSASRNKIRQIHVLDLNLIKMKFPFFAQYLKPKMKIMADNGNYGGLS
jgi:hypothetical protein